MQPTIILSLLILSLILTAIQRGLEEAVLWSRLGADAFTWNEHIILVVGRMLFMANMILSATYCSCAVVGTRGIWIVLLATLGMLLTFPILHNGSYYESRNWIATHNGTIKPYSKGWKDQSTTSTANINFDLFNRVLLGSLGLIIYIGAIVFNIIILS